jgi:GDP-L-fucose synthase
MIAKFHNATQNNESVNLWGDGSAMREFLHVDDLAEACYVCMQNYNESEHINVGTGEDVKIWELANIISEVVDFPGEITWDFTKPNGTPRKVLNVDKIKSFGWEPKIGLRAGIESTYEWFLKNVGV